MSTKSTTAKMKYLLGCNMKIVIQWMGMNLSWGREECARGGSLLWDGAICPGGTRGMSKSSAIGGTAQAPNMQTLELVTGSLFLPSVVILYSPEH